PAPNAHAAHVGQIQLVGITDDDVLDLAAPANKHADLPLELLGHIAQVGAELTRDYLGRRHTPAIDALEHLRLRRFKAVGVSENLLQSPVMVMALLVAGNRSVYDDVRSLALLFTLQNRILLVDDDAEALARLADTLAAPNLFIDIAKNSDEALAQLRRNGYSM